MAGATPDAATLFNTSTNGVSLVDGGGSIGLGTTNPVGDAITSQELCIPG